MKDIRVKSKECGHICLVYCKNLTRTDALKQCPQCKKEKLSSSKTEERFCLECGKELLGGQKKFCSQSCSTTYNNKHREINKKPKVLINCLNCGKEMPERVNGNKRKFCSHSCSAEYSYKEKQKKLQEYENKADSEKIKNKKLSKTIRKEIFKEFNNSCEICGWNTINPFTNKVPLQIHHKDGNPENHERSNLQLLCPNCHALTETYGNRNLGKGREARRVRRWKNDTNN